jgi:hypothetical protein
MDQIDRSAFLESAAPTNQAGLPSRGPCAKLRWKSQKTKSSRLWGQPFENILDMLEAAIAGSPSEATLRSYEKQARCEVPPHLSGSTRSEIKAEFRSPSVQLGELPGLGPHREMFMPGSRLMEAEFGDELVHLGIKLDYHSVGIIVVAGYIVAGRVPRRAPPATRLEAQ